MSSGVSFVRRADGRGKIHIEDFAFNTFCGVNAGGNLFTHRGLPQLRGTDDLLLCHACLKALETLALTKPRDEYPYAWQYELLVEELDGRNKP